MTENAKIYIFHVHYVAQSIAKLNIRYKGFEPDKEMKKDILIINDSHIRNFA